MVLTVSVTAVLKLLTKGSILVSYCQRQGVEQTFLLSLLAKNSAMLGSLNFSILNLILTLPWFFVLWRRSLKLMVTCDIS